MSMLVLPTTGTLLVLTPLSGLSAPQLTPYSSRNLTQTYELLQGAGGSSGGGWTRRDVNAVLRSVADTRFRKYRSTITCADGVTPALDDTWIGVTCEVACAFEFSFPIGGFPARPVVSGSEREDSGFLFYRPLLTCLITDIKDSFAEWKALHQWEVSLEEV
jgi:hypothetical protein